MPVHSHRLSISQPESVPESLERQRFQQVLRQAMVVNDFSQRQLSEAMGVKIGTMTKYLNGEIRPLRVALEIQAGLASCLGVTLDALLAFYRSGELVTQVTVRDVESWLRSDAGQEDLPVIMASLQEAGQRWLSGSGPMRSLPEPKVPKPYTWPLQEIEELGLSDTMRQRLGLTAADLAPLVERGEFSEDLVEAFSVAANYDLEAVREAFAARRPIV